MELDGVAVPAGGDTTEQNEAREAKNRYMRFYRSLRSSSPTIMFIYISTFFSNPNCVDMVNTTVEVLCMFQPQRYINYIN